MFATSCWEYFNCPEKFRNECKVYLSRSERTMLCEGWFKYDPMEGGPAKRGPCAECEILKSMYPEIYSIFQDKSNKK